MAFPSLLTKPCRNGRKKKEGKRDHDVRRRIRLAHEQPSASHTAAFAAERAPAAPLASCVYVRGRTRDGARWICGLSRGWGSGDPFIPDRQFRRRRLPGDLRGRYLQPSRAFTAERRPPHVCAGGRFTLPSSYKHSHCATGVHCASERRPLFPTYSVHTGKAQRGDEGTARGIPCSGMHVHEFASREKNGAFHELVPFLGPLPSLLNQKPSLPRVPHILALLIYTAGASEGARAIYSASVPLASWLLGGACIVRVLAHACLRLAYMRCLDFRSARPREQASPLRRCLLGTFKRPPFMVCPRFLFAPPHRFVLYRDHNFNCPPYPIHKLLR
ncbi:hypothetical protein HPB51_015817 [Rhipicephalus microplus]|uniref:Uncharacterized protein n=1 Tax=Rhipicephalus microplus TaxID=6941 RepID=A0A9J6F4Q0_RHIMP|nr:hypothetical protein HPB51_015817 [Rhipicephalus microplus]